MEIWAAWSTVIEGGGGGGNSGGGSQRGEGDRGNSGAFVSTEWIMFPHNKERADACVATEMGGHGIWEGRTNEPQPCDTCR
jgi:hypothetical protein